MDCDTGTATQNPAMKHMKCNTISASGQIVLCFGLGGSVDNPMANLTHVSQQSKL